MIDTGGVAALVRWYVAILTCLIYTINIADRYVVSTVLEPIRLELQLSDKGVAFLTGVPLGLFYVTLGIPLSWLADRSNRRNILAACIVVWSVFTTACGLSRNYLQFMLARIGVGSGEAGGTPTSNSLLADYFPAARRPMAYTILALGAPLGAWLGADLAGAIANDHGWRSAFLALGIPGVLLGLLVLLTVREPVRGRLDKVDWSATRLAHGIARLPVAADGRVPRDHGCRRVLIVGLGPDLVDADFPDAHLLDECRRSRRGHRAHPSHRRCDRQSRHRLAVRAPLDGRSAARMLGARRRHRVGDHSFNDRFPDAFTAAGARDVLVVHTGDLFLHRPLHGAGAESRAPHMRSVFTAWSGLCGNVFNLIVAPQLVGFLSDWYAGGHATDAASLRFGLLVLAPTGFWAAWHLYVASRTIVVEQRIASEYGAGGTGGTGGTPAAAAAR